jgi:hypothetical protein
MSPGETATASHIFSPGELVADRYAIVRFLGEGGMGEVYEAEDRELHLHIALKTVRPDLAGDQDTMARFRREIALARRVTHHNVCRTFDVGYHVRSVPSRAPETIAFLTMELLTGVPLADRIRERGPMSPAEAWPLIRQMAAALEAAHQAGVVHRDFKSANVFLVGEVAKPEALRVVVTDFGLARPSAPEPEESRAGPSGHAEAPPVVLPAVQVSLTGSRELLGTPAYMAPEQLTGEPITAATDIYALGVVIYEMLTGRRPFEEKTALGTAIKRLTTPAPSPRQLQPALSARWEHAILRCLEREPSRRWPSCGALVCALEGESPAAGRRPGRAGVLLGGLLLAAALGASLMALRRAPPATSTWRPRMEDRRPRYDESAGPPLISPDGRHLAYMAERDDLIRMYVEPLGGGPARALPEVPQTRLSHWMHDSRALLGVTVTGRILRIPIDGSASEELGGPATDVADCAGRLVFREPAREGASEASGARLVLQEGLSPNAPQRELARFPGDLRLRQLLCDRSGRRLAWISGTPASLAKTPQNDNALHVLDLDGGPARRLLADGKMGWAAWASDARSLILASSRGGALALWEIGLTGKDPVPLPVEFPDLGGSLSFDLSPDGKLLVYSLDGVGGRQIHAYDLAGHSGRRINAPLEQFWSPQALADDRALFVMLEREAKTYAALLSLNDGAVRILTDAMAATVTPDGHGLVYASAEGGGAGIWTLPLSGGAARRLGEVPERVRALAVDRGGWIHARAPLIERGLWKIPPGGGVAVPEDTWETSAPVGGWRLVYRRQARNMIPSVLELRAPFQPPEAPPARVFTAIAYAVWLPDGQSFLYYKGDEIRRYFVTTARDVPVLHQGFVDGLTLSRDGQTLYVVRTIEHSTRYMIVNFDGRPRPVE